MLFVYRCQYFNWYARKLIFRDLHLWKAPSHTLPRLRSKRGENFLGYFGPTGKDCVDCKTMFQEKELVKKGIS